MNKHKNYWSVMGIEPDKEESYMSLKRKADKETILKIINSYNGNGLREVTNIFREIHLET